MIELTIPLGAAVAKAACKIWLGDIPLAEDASASLIDIVESKVGGVRERRRVNRIFESIEEKVAEHLLRVLEREYRDIPEGDRNATLLAVESTIGSASLSSRDIIGSDLDPILLKRRILQYQDNRQVRDLSQDATQLYDQILHQCCVLIVESVNTLPGFENAAFAELLSRQTETLTQIENLTRSLESITSNSGVSLFEAAYRRLVITQLDRMQLFGFTASNRFTRYPLRASYISLTAHSQAVSNQAKERSASEADGVQLSDGMARVDSAISLSSRILVRGDAGSGKTTLLQWIAVQSASGRFSGPLQRWNGTTPFYVRLRDYAGAELPSPELFLRGIGRHISDEMPRNLGTRQTERWICPNTRRRS